MELLLYCRSVFFVQNKMYAEIELPCKCNMANIFAIPLTIMKRNPMKHLYFKSHGEF